MFKHDDEKIKHEYDELLIETIDQTKQSWDHARQTQAAVYENDSDRELEAKSKLEEKKFMYLYLEARRRKVHGRMQSSVFDQ